MDQRTNNSQSKIKYEESQDDRKMKSETDDLEASLSEGKDGDYIQKLLKEKMSLDKAQCPNTIRLINKEIAQSQKSKVQKDVQYVDIYREKPIKVSVKVLVPVKVHPNFNFVGKLLGPKGNSLKRLQEDTMTRMLILGRGSIKDKEKEEELRQSLDPKYSHLCDDLHVDISVLAPPAEAHARMAYALAEIRKYLIPDYYDEIRKEQMQEIQAENHQPVGQTKAVGRGRAPLSRGMPLSQRQRTAQTMSQANKSVLHSVRNRAYASAKDAYDFYGDQAEKWQTHRDYGRAAVGYYNEDYDVGATSYNSYKNFVANKSNNRRIPRRLM